MKADHLELTIWDALKPAGREDVARAVSRKHPQFEFQEIRPQAQGDQAHHIAFFDWRGIEFALLPGSEAVLGYDPRRSP